MDLVNGKFNQTIFAVLCETLTNMPTTIVLTERDLSIPQQEFIHASYEQLRESVYQALAA